MTEVYLFPERGFPVQLEMPLPADEIVQGINAGRWEGLLGFQHPPILAWEAVRIGKRVIISEAEAPGLHPGLRLTRRELQTLQLLAGGRTIAQAAYDLHIEVRTLRTYTTALRRKFKANTTQQLLALATALGFVRPEIDHFFD